MAGYGDDSTFEAWATENGYTLPTGGLSAEVLRNRGAAYIDGVYGARFSGIPTGGFEQERAWPRTGAYAFGQPIGDSIIPDAVIKASYAAAWQEASSPGSLNASYTPGTQKVLTKVDKIEWEVIGDSSKEGAMSLVLTAVEGLLVPFLSPAGSFPAILVV